jgi:lipoate-protein ligase B
MSVCTFKKACIAPYLGIVPYEVALKLQQGLMQARAEGRIGDVILLLQHPSVFTVGRFRGREDIIVPPETLAREGIAVFHTNRGGGITYHGPGQLVGYPIVNLKENGLGVREYIRKLEAAIIKLLLALDIQGYRPAGYPGVWASGKKVCSIGIHVSRNITTHGFALNVTNDLRYFAEYIRPCGLQGQVMTSISELLGHRVEMETIIEKLLPAFSETFCLSCVQESDRWLAILDAQSG